VATILRDTIQSLRQEPARWQTDAYGCEITRDDGLTVWIGNGAYGMHISAQPLAPLDGPVLWGDVTMLSSVGLSIPHWRLLLACKRWSAARRQVQA